RWRLVHRAANLISHFAGCLLEFLYAGAEPLGQFRKLLGSKQNQNHCQDQNDLPATEKCTDYSHKLSINAFINLSLARGLVKRQKALETGKLRPQSSTFKEIPKSKAQNRSLRFSRSWSIREGYDKTPSVNQGLQPVPWEA